MVLEYRMKQAGQRVIEFFQQNALVIATPSSNNIKEESAHEHHKMVNTEIRLIYSLQPKMEKLYTVSQSKTRS